MDNISQNLSEKDDSNKNKLFSFLRNKFFSEVSFVFALADFLENRQWESNNFVCAPDVAKKLQKMTELVQGDDDGRLSDTAYYEFSTLLDSVYQNEELLNFCKNMDSSQVSKDVKDFMNTINTYFHNIDNPIMYDNDNENEETCIKQISEENELYKKDIMYLCQRGEINSMKIKYDEKVQEYEKEKKFLDENIKQLYELANSNIAQIKMKNKSDVLEHLKTSMMNIEKIEKLTEDKQKQLEVLKESNIAESDYITNELFKKEMHLKTTITEYSDIMFSKYKERENLQRTNKSLKNSVEVLEEKLKSMQIYRKELIEDETMYFKREYYDKLAAIRKKIALRTISKFLMPYVNMKFKSRRTKQNPKNKKTDKSKK